MATNENPEPVELDEFLNDIVNNEDEPVSGSGDTRPPGVLRGSGDTRVKASSRGSGDTR